MLASQPGTPDVSVIIPAYNAASTIAETLASVFVQSRRNFEVIVVDDGSRDRVALDKVLASWRDRLHLVRQANQGAGAARNAALAVARGRFVAFLDADDMWLPDFLDRQLAVLGARPDLDMIWSDGWIVGETPLAGRTYLAATATREAPAFLSLVRQTCSVLTSAVVVRRSMVEAVRGFDDTIRRGQDFDLWLRLAHDGAVMAVHTEPLVYRRVHGANLSGDEVTQLRRAIAVLDGLYAKLPLRLDEHRAVDARLAALVSQLDLELGKAALRDGALAEARDHLSRCGARHWKARLAGVGLRIAPGLLRHVYLRSSGQPAARGTSLPT